MRSALVVYALTIALQTGPEMHLAPPKLQLHADSVGFAQGRVQVLNRGGEPLEIRRVVPSCKCAAATVLSNPIYPLEVGQLLVQVNTHDWRDSIGTIELDIESNAPPQRYVVTVHPRR